VKQVTYTATGFHKRESADWKANPEEMLAQIDRQLEAHGLEIVVHEDGSDQYIWTIEKRNTTN
jgi:hypothetical protein